MYRLCLRFKILTGLAIISFCAMSTLIMVLRSYLSTSLEAQLVKRGEFIGQSLAETSVNPILSRQFLSLDLKLYESRNNDKDLAYIFIVDPSHVPVSHTFASGFPVEFKQLSSSAQAGTQITRVHLGDQRLFDISVPILDGKLGRLHVGMSEVWVHREIGSMLLIVSCVITLLFVAAAVAMWLYLERMVIRPIRELDDQVRLLGEGQFEARSTVGSRDELGSLGKALNDMGQHLNRLYAELSDRNEELSSLNEKLGELAITDGLTGLCNHRHFYERLGEEVKRSKRYSNPLALIMGDLDHFKHYNDTLGHVAGDKVLKIVATLIQDNARENDLVARYGGEEFAIILPETSLETARLAAERMRSIIENSPALAAVAVAPGESITMSFGVAEMTDDVDGPKDFVRLADAMLYRAKRSGRNRVES